MSYSKTVTFIVQIYMDMEFDQLPESEDWIRMRLQFFQNYTLRSLQLQSFKDFRIFLLCGKRFKEITGAWSLPSIVERCYDRSRQKYKEIDTDYVAITRLDSDDLYHKDAMRDVRDNLILSDRRECLIFRTGWTWDMMNRFLLPRYRLSPPFYTHIFPKAIYRNWQQLQDEHFMGHGRAGGRLPETRELPKGRHVVIKHNGNVGPWNRELASSVLPAEDLNRLKGKHPEMITDQKKIREILADFGVSEELIP